MNKNTINNKDDIWLKFAEQENLSEEQLEKFKKYAYLLQEWNKVTNITRITDIEHIIFYHFQDSLKIANFVDFDHLKMTSDVGTGGGFPGLPIKIKYPHLSLVLIEVNSKKREFLKTVVDELELDNVEISDLDWRTFLRKTEYPIDIFFARASLHTDELLRIFKTGCVYKKAQMVYWASDQWKPNDFDNQYLMRQEEYIVGDKKRKFIFFALKNNL